ncbi:hypothetical protein Ahy_A02g007513 isoform B [Arachis hypogaea]|nr:hypothetical protein Ahy_A02g007513 isoform B [Arachis hypogaea]
MTSYGGTVSFLWVGPVCCSFLAPISLWGGLVYRYNLCNFMVYSWICKFLFRRL